ncbi:LysE family translocator [Paracoccus aestuarii]|uniref:LysE family translocator n=1 Tax=Paracoccus aestuarii TaxID=453842 RepID=A0A418ZU55_9RHOB|nr:LysE family translocator [Paracoccus aestuarii]RJL01426.1 LysE family translocator [Paracoccus aestuarii]WCQ98230.1 LysE family translocator [Paracoccus aestuarii]
MLQISAAELGVFVATLSVAILSPGPGVIAVSQGAFSLGRRRALAYGWGLAIGASVWCLFALLGLTALFRIAPWTLTAMRLAGGAYLLWIGWRMWRHARDPLPGPGSRGMGFGAGVALNLSNPKPALFYSAVLLSIFPAALSPADKGAIYAVALSVELFFYTALASLMALPVLRRRYYGSKFWIDRAAGLAIAALGLSLVLRP